MTVGPWQRFWSPFWVLPVVICAIGVLAGLFVPLVDRTIAEHLPVVFGGGPDGARSLLSTIASAMISVTGLVFSITMVVLQLASSQFTPRVVGNFLASRITQVTLGVFTATFSYALTVLRSVRGSSATVDQFVPQASITIAFTLVLACVGLFLAFIHHVTRSIQVDQVISRTGDRTRREIELVIPESVDPGRSGLPTWSPTADQEFRHLGLPRSHGSVLSLDIARMSSIAQQADVVVVLLRRIGDFSPEGRPLAQVWGAPSDDVLAQLRSCWQLGDTRSIAHDVSFGIRQLVDIADRALSPGVNDPTTAVQVIDELHNLFLTWVQRGHPERCVLDDDGAVRVVAEPITSGDALWLATSEILRYGKDEPRITDRMVEMIDDLLDAAHASHRDLIESVRARFHAQLLPS